MILVGTASGRNRDEIVENASRLAEECFEESKYRLEIGTINVDSEVVQYANGETAMESVTFSAEFKATEIES